MFEQLWHEEPSQAALKLQPDTVSGWQIPWRLSRPASTRDFWTTPCSLHVTTPEFQSSDQAAMGVVIIEDTSIMHPLYRASSGCML